MEKIGVDLSRVAEKVVRDCMLIKPGERFWIMCGDPFYMDFAHSCAIETIKAGAYPLITLSSDEISMRKFDNSLDYLRNQPDFSTKLVEVADAGLQIVFPRDPERQKTIPPEKSAAAAIGGISMTEAIVKRNHDRSNLRLSSFLYPTPEAARHYGMNYEEYADLIWGAVDIDYNALSARAKKLASIMRTADRVHITNPEGTDLVFSIKNRPILIDDGVMDEEDIISKTYLQNLPTGEIYMPPIEDSAEGTAVFSYNIFMGEPLVNLRVRFEKGKIVEMKADRGLDYYRNIMDNNTGEKYRIAELGIGLNPRIKKVIGDLALDEKIIGTIHIATGENRIFGGENQSSIHWDLVMDSPTVSVDGRVIMENGQYRV